MEPHVVLHSPLPPAEAEAAIRAAISDPPLLGMDFFAARGTKGFVGKVRDGKVRVRVRLELGVASGRGWRPWFRGRLLPDGEGSRLEGRFTTDPRNWVGVAWVGLFLAGFLAGGMGMLLKGDPRIPGTRWTGLFVVAIVLVFAAWVLFIRFNANQFDDDEEVLRRFLSLHLRVPADGPGGEPAALRHP